MNDGSVTILPAAPTQELQQFQNADLADMPPLDDSDDLLRDHARSELASVTGEFDRLRLLQSTKRDPRVAVVHEWFESYAGSERVLEQILACFPQADLFAVADFMPEQERSFL